jgi:hypothetical protein
MIPSIAQLLPLLGADYEQMCYDLRVIQRTRAFKTPADLMMLCLFHLINGVSLLAVSSVALMLGIGKFSDVAFMSKFAKCGEWFKRISKGLVREGMTEYSKPSYMEGRRVLAVDASDVVEKGRSGKTYRLHYAIDIYEMNSDTFKITPENVGERLSNFAFRSGDVVLGDRAYGTVSGIEHCLNCGADYILRLRTGCFSVYDGDGAKIDMLSRLDGLAHEENGEFYCYVHPPGKPRIPVRICVRRKDKEACERAEERLKSRARRKRQVLREKTKQFNEYIVLVTSLPGSVPVEGVLETYRYRWQVEIHFKRLKSILDFGELPKKNPVASETWLNGKIMVALLIELFISKAAFPPGGKSKHIPQHLA